MTALMDRKKRDGPAGKDDRSNRKTAPIQIEKDLARMVAVIAAHDGTSQSDLISPEIRDFVWRNYARVQKEIQDRLARRKQDQAPGG